MPCVRRTLIVVPAGTLTVLGSGLGGGGGAADVADAAGRAGGGVGGGGAGFRAENSTASACSIGTSRTWPSSSSTRTDLLSAPMNMPSMTLPERSFTRSADSVMPADTTRMVAVIHRWLARLICDSLLL